MLKQYLGERRAGQSFRVLYQPSSGDILGHWRKVGVLAYATGDLFLGIDELGLLSQYGNVMPDNKQGRRPILIELVHMGRHRQIKVSATAQRPSDMPLRYRALCEEMRIFRTSEKNDLTYIQERVGESATSKLPMLQKFCFVHWKDGTDDDCKIYRPKLKAG